MNTRKTHLKIKIKSLAAEAVIIKREEAKWKFAPYTNPFDNEYRGPHPMFFSLRQHRLEDVRKECRHAIIAYGFLRGRSYKTIEAKCHEPPLWPRVIEIVRSFGGYGILAPDKRKELHDQVLAWSKEEIKREEAA